jgi:pimeloyl-ACP methyl ester carboxylesterase
LLILLETSFGHGDSRAFAREQNINRLRPSQIDAPQLMPQSLPEPAGGYRIGTAIFHLTDTARRDLISKRPGQFRELMLQVWYPTDVASKARIASYIPNLALLQALKDEQHDGLNPAVIEGWKDVQTNTTLDAPLSRKRVRFSLLFFSHGLGESRSSYTAFSRELASHGYIVACIDHPYGGITILPDGRLLSTDADPDAGNPEATAGQVEAWAKDASFVLERMTSPAKTDSALARRFAGHIDSGRVGMLGHSLGGAAALEACRTDSRFKACADLDGAPFGKVTEEGLNRPTLILRSGPVYSDEDLIKKGRTREQWEEMGRQGRAMWDSLIQKSKNVPVYSISIKGTGHMSFSDAPFVMPDTINRFGGRIIEARRGFEIMTHYVRDFFDKYFNGKHSELLDGTHALYSEVIVWNRP